PILMVVALGIAFRNKPVDQIPVDVVDEPAAAAALKVLQENPLFTVKVHDQATCLERWRHAKTDVVVTVLPGPRYHYLFDPNRTQSRLARDAVANALQKVTGRTVPVEDETLDQPGSRYIDFLVPGLLGMSLMGGGLWGVGFVIVDMRIRKLLKRFLATPMK